MNGLSKDSVTRLAIGDEAAGQRVDNFLVRILKGVPKSHIYRILRSGEVRVNRKRVGPDARLALGDEVRIPPVRDRGAGRRGAATGRRGPSRAPCRRGRCRRCCTRTTR